MSQVEPSGQRRRVVSLRYDGLGARLCCMAGALFLAEEIKGTCLTLWPLAQDHISNDSLAFCFAPSWSRYWNGPGDDDATLIREGTFLTSSQIRRIVTIDTIHETCCDDETVDTFLYRGIYRPDAGLATYRNYRSVVSGLLARHIRFSDRVLDKVALIKSKTPITDCIGVHVRRGDLATAPNGLSLWVEVEQYFDYIDAHHRGSYILLCCEDPIVTQQFRNKYESRIISIPLIGTSRASNEAIEGALVEILLLSATKSLIGGVSNFIDFAALYGNLDFKVLKRP